MKSETASSSHKAWHQKHKEEFKTAMLGHAVSNATKEKISKSVSKYYEDEESRKKTSDALKKAYKMSPRSKETIEKQRASLKKMYESRPEIKQKISESMKSYYAEHPKHREEISRATSDAMQLFYKTEKGQKNLRKWTDGARAKGTSSPEKELQDFVRSILDGKELDIYIPSKKVAVEYNGNIWHSEAYKKDKASSCQLEKTVVCEQKGIRLIHVFSDEWENKQDIIKSIIASALGHYNKKYMARKLEFKETSFRDASAFFKVNHIQGSTAAQRCFRLYDNDELVQCISIGKNSFKRDKSRYELIRMAVLLNVQVLGGFSKLIKNAMKAMQIVKIESYIDRRLFNGYGYMSSGWTVEGSSSPRYFYTNGKTRENRQTYMKQSYLKKWPKCTPDMTEHEMCLMHHLYRIYDCGTIKVSFSLID